MSRRRLLIGSAAALVLVAAIALVPHLSADVTYRHKPTGLRLSMSKSFAKDIEVREQTWDSFRILNFVYKPVQALYPDFPFGTVGRIEIFDRTAYTIEDLEDMTTMYGLRLVGENSRYYFGAAHATDVQVPLDAAEELQARFRELEAEFNEVIKSLRFE